MSPGPTKSVSAVEEPRQWRNGQEQDTNGKGHYINLKYITFLEQEFMTRRTVFFLVCEQQDKVHSGKRLVETT